MDLGSSESRAEGSGLRARVRFRVQGSGFRVQGSGLGFRVSGFKGLLRARELWFRV